MPDVGIRLLSNIWASQTVECIGLGMLYYFETIMGFLDQRLHSRPDDDLTH